MARTGRPRSFDRDNAVRKAMELFWQYGYESTSLTQLKAVMGNISAASFYAAFTSKEALFKEVVSYYIAAHGQVTACLSDTDFMPKEAIELALRRSAKMQTDNSHPFGCLLVLSASTCSPENKHIQDIVAQERAKTREKIKSCILRAVEIGNLPEFTDIDMMTTLFHTFLLGISIQTRDGTPFETINAAITRLMRVWDEVPSSTITVP